MCLARGASVYLKKRVLQVQYAIKGIPNDGIFSVLNLDEGYCNIIDLLLLKIDGSWTIYQHLFVNMSLTISKYIFIISLS